MSSFNPNGGSVTPSSRLIFKNIPRTYTEQEIRDQLILKSKTIKIDITEVKMLQRQDRFCGVCFIGFKTTQQAQAIQKYWNNAFFDKSRVSVEFISAEQQVWSKFNPKSLIHQTQLDKLQEHSDQRQAQLARIIANSHQKSDVNFGDKKPQQPLDKTKLLSHPALFGLTEEEKLKVLEQPKFFEFLNANQSKSQRGKSWENSTLQESFQAAGITQYPGMGHQQGMIGGGGGDDDDFFAGPGLNQGDNDENEPLIKIVTLDDEARKKELKEQKAKAKLEKKEQKAQAKREKKERKEQEKLAQLKPKVSTDADFLRMTMGGFTSDEEEEETAAKAPTTESSTSSSSSSESSSSSSSSSDDDDDDDDNNNKKKKTTTDDKKQNQNKRLKTNDNKNDQNSEIVQLDEPIDPREAILSSSSLFVRNLAFQTKEVELEDHFSQHGDIVEVAFPLDRLGHSIGYATVVYRLPEDAWIAYQNLNGTIFQGRFIHIIPGQIPKGQLKNQFSDDQLDAMTHKRKKLMQLKSTANSNYNWNSLFISQDTIANAVSAKLNITKGALLGADAEKDSQSAAVRMAIAETHIISETKTFLEEHGVNLDKFNSTPVGGNKVARSNTVILVKNIPFSVEEGEIRKIFSRFGVIDRLILPPYKTMALVEMLNPIHAKNAFLNLSYKKLKDVPIYLEWGPKDCLKSAADTANKGGVVSIADNNDDKSIALDLADVTDGSQESVSIFVKNIHFNTTDDELQAHFTNIIPLAYKQYIQDNFLKAQQLQSENWRVRMCRIKRRQVHEAKGLDKNKTVGELLSLGYGFVEMSHPSAAKGLLSYIHKIGGTTLQGHLLALRLSKPSDDDSLTNTGSTADLLKKKTILLQKGILSEKKILEQQQWSQQNQKVIIRNIPFEANPKEIRETFQAFGQIKRCTLPVKPGTNQHRGYGFIEFISPAEAKTAFEALSSTHIFGRHLVIEWAKPDDDIEDLREQAKEAASKMGKK